MNEGAHNNYHQSIQEQRLSGSPFECLATWEEYDPQRGDTTNAREWFNSQAKSLVSWATENGFLIDQEVWTSRLEASESLEGGREHNVFHCTKEKRVFKYTIPPKFGIQEYVSRYAMNQILANKLFDDDIRFEGVLEIGDAVSIVISQSYVEGTQPTEQEIENWFREIGFKNRGMYCWWHPELRIEIADAHKGNLLKSPNGSLIPIDVQITEHPEIFR